MFRASVTVEISHDPMSALKDDAPLNMFHIVPTFATFHDPMLALKDEP